MKKLSLLLLAVLTFGLVGCENTDPAPAPVDATPTIALTKGLVEANAVTFTVATTDATEVAYMVLGDEETAPTIDVIFTSGTTVALDENGAAEVRAENLEAETSYQIVAAAKNNTKSAGSNTLYVTTTPAAALSLNVEIVQYDHEKMNFRVDSANADRIAYLVLYASKGTPEASYVLLNGDEIEVGSKESVEVTGLECAKEYQLVVVAEGVGQTLMAEPVLFTTKDDPSNVVEHNYTRARASKYGSNCFVMFSYPDANETDNFAYNDKTLCLDFYTEAEKDYLTAGTYEVKESTDPYSVSSYRYSTYGYDNGVQLSSGRVIVAIDEETKAYSFDIDLFLKDGRHLVATYNGDVDGMPVVDKVTIDTTYTTANATTTDNGITWNLVLTDEAGNAAHINLTNAFKAPYIVNNVYTISSSAEEFAAQRMAADLGQFDGDTSKFVVAGANGGEFKFATGTLTMDINWETLTYMLSFYGTLENGYIIESKFNGVIEGCSLAQSEEVIDVVLNTATARAFENNTNWYMIFTQTLDGVENYRLTLDAYCPAMDYLPAGTYQLGNAVDGRYLGYDLTTLIVAGESTYVASEARANVTVDMSAKTYTFQISFKVQDGRTFVMSYIGKVDGMEIKDAEDVPDTINWTTVTARHWTSDNWQLVIADETGDYNLEFDLRTGNSSVNYLVSGVYTLDRATTQYVDNNYSKFNSNTKAFKEVTLNVTYLEASQTYEISFDVTLTDDRNLKGSYTGAVAGSPKAQ